MHAELCSGIQLKLIPLNQIVMLGIKLKISNYVPCSFPSYIPTKLTFARVFIFCFNLDNRTVCRDLKITVS